MYRMDWADGRLITAFDSKAAMIAPILRNTAGCHVAFLKLNAGGNVGLHPAVGEQLFFVLEGEGWVEGGDGKRVMITSGEAAFWSNGENHQTGSDHGLTALVIEGEDLVVRMSLTADEAE
ncbi:cupin domain-containing protein [Paenibacillus tundrae]